MSTTLFFFFLALILSSPTVFAAGLPLSPYPNKLELGPGVFHVAKRFGIEVTSNTDDDRFAASLLATDLRSLDGVAAGKGKGSARIVLARAESAAGKRILQKSGLQFPAQADEEGYILVVTSQEASIVSKTAAGIF